MQAVPNLDFTPSDSKDFGKFVQMLQKVWRNLTTVINGNLGFGDGTHFDNISGTWANVVAPVAPNTDFTITHNLNRIPVGYLIMQKDRACDVYTGSVAATKTQLTLRATVASAVLRLFIIGLLISLSCLSTKAQTTVNLTVQDTPDNQTWNNGSWSVVITTIPGGNPPAGAYQIQSGGGSLAPQSGTLSGTGTASMALPANSNITPAQSIWSFQVCPQGTPGPSCFVQRVVVGTSSPQTLNLTPPSIRIDIKVATPPLAAYGDGELTGALIGSQYYNTTTQTERVCQAINGTSGLNCTTWANAALAGAAGSSGQAQVNQSGNIAGAGCTTYDNKDTGPTRQNCNWISKGPNPYVDISAFGARAVNPNTTPAAAGLTASCTSGQPTVSISSASTFVNGDGVIIYGCGAPHSMSTPSGVSVTPSLALAGTGTLIDTPGPTGATTYNYQVIARDRNGGLTTASATASTTTGAASLGAQTVNITSMTASGRTVTATTASAHGFLVGCSLGTCGEVFIGGGNAISDVTFRGWFIVTGASDTTHFTFTRPGDTSLGASTSATGGTATYFNLNKISWSAVTPANSAVYYGIYSDRASAGTCALIGVSNALSSTSTQDLSFEDFGSPMMDNQTFPAIFPTSYPCASPPAATSDSLSTTILSGAGTTTLTLANVAGASTTGGIRIDTCPAILAAQASIISDYGTLQIPADSTLNNNFVVNSWCQINGSQEAIGQMGALYLNDTVEVTATGNGGAKWLGDMAPQRGNGPFVGAWSSLPRITINGAHPGIYFSGSQQALHLGHVQIASAPNNGTLGVLADSGFNQTFDWVDCGPGSGLNDYMSSCFQFRASPGGGNSNVTLDYIGLSPGGGGDGVSHTPTVYFRGSGNVIIPHSYSLHRGMLYSGNSSIQLGVGGVAYINGGGTPLLTDTGSFSNAVIGGAFLDTIAQPVVSNIISGANSSSIQFLSGTPVPSSGVPPISGNPTSVTGLTTKGLAIPSSSGPVPGNLTDSIIGFSNSYLQQQQNAALAVGVNYPMFIQGIVPSLNSCPVSAGGSLSVGTHVFTIAPLWWNSDNGNQSNSCTAVTSTGNQTVTLNWTLIPGNPKQIRFFDGPGNRITSQTGLATDTSAVLTSETIAGGTADSYSGGGPTMLMPGTQGIASPNYLGPQYQLTSSGFTSTDTTTLTANRTITTPDASGLKTIILGSPTALNIPQFTATSGTLSDSGVPVKAVPTVLYLQSNYTNNTTTFSNVVGLSFSTLGSSLYKVRCDLDYQTNATTADIQIQWTGPGSPNFVTYDMIADVTGSSLSSSVATAFSTALAGTGTPTTGTNFPLTLTMTLKTGLISGTVQLQAAATGAGTITIIPGSCSLQQ